MEIMFYLRKNALAYSQVSRREIVYPLGDNACTQKLDNSDCSYNCICLDILGHIILKSLIIVVNNDNRLLPIFHYNWNQRRKLDRRRNINSIYA